MDYLNGIGKTNTFETFEHIAVDEYVKPAGVYYFFITALAPKTNSFYADSNESSTYGIIDKLESLSAPTDITFLMKLMKSIIH